MQMWEHNQSQDNEDYIQISVCKFVIPTLVNHWSTLGHQSILYFLKFYVNGIIIFILFLSMSTIIWRIIHAVACTTVHSFLFQ